MQPVPPGGHLLHEAVFSLPQEDELMPRKTSRWWHLLEGSPEKNFKTAMSIYEDPTTFHKNGRVLMDVQ